MSTEERGDRFRELEETYRDYTVYDQHYERIGKVDDLFVDENDQPEYIGVKTGFLGMKSTLVPMELARVNDLRKLIEVAAGRDTIQSAPSFDDDEEITPEHEARIHAYFGLEHPGLPQGGYGDYYDSDEPFVGEDLSGAVDTEYGERREEPLSPPTGSSYPGGDSPYNAPSGTEPSGEDRQAGGPLSDDEPEPLQADSVRVYKRVRGSR
ncbi:MAG TPA: PRC-barrel domain-containing protein [Rubrobacteraceae bacterium]|nr:PRC-barrel domain-containing protein [Rubrobacteraceae bacterium]